MKRIVILIFIVIFFQSCASFSELPKTIKAPIEIKGVYSNDCDSTNFWIKEKLWGLVNSEWNSKEDSLSVRFEITSNNKLMAILMGDDKILSKKVIEGKFKEDNCYYTRRAFYIVPILPILWWFSNRQERIYYMDETLVYENTYNRGGLLL